MFRIREARAVLVTSALWGALHGVFGAVLGAWSFFRMDHAPWAALPQWMLWYSFSSITPGVLAGVSFCILLRLFERSLTVETVSATRVVGWGILASLPAFSVMYGTLPVILQGSPDGLPLLVLATARSALAGAVVALVTLAIARLRVDPGRPTVGKRPLVSRLLSSSPITELLRSRGSKSDYRGAKVQRVGSWHGHTSWDPFRPRIRRIL